MTDENSKAPDKFLAVLEDGVCKVLANKKAKPSERIAAIAAGVKIAMVKFKISGDAEDNFFK